MGNRSYPSTSSKVRTELELLIDLPDDSPQWPSFMQREMRLAGWLLPAVQAAIREGAWRTTPDPIAQITGSVRRIAIEMGLRNASQTHEPDGGDEDDEEE